MVDVDLRCYKIGNMIEILLVLLYSAYRVVLSSLGVRYMLVVWEK
jgi:hypothetical protein